MNMKKKRVIIVLWLLSAVAFVGTSSAVHRWGQYKFHDRHLGWYNGGTGGYYDVYQEEAMTDGDAWNPFTVVEVVQIGPGPDSSDQINSFNGNYGDTGWSGLAEIQKADGWEIDYGRTLLNQYYLDAASLSDQKHVACQEIGHMFGLGHNRVQSDTCMNDRTFAPTAPNAHDAEELAFIYAYSYPPPNRPEILVPGEVLLPNQEVVSINGRFRLVYQDDGNLVLRMDGVPTWDSGTNGTSPGQTVMQHDGNLVVKDASGAVKWASNTSGHDGAYLTVWSWGQTTIQWSPHNGAFIWIKP